MPRCYGRATPANALKKDICFPVVVKQVASHVLAEYFGRKLLVAKTRNELSESIRIVQAAGLEARIYDLVPGLHTSFYNYSVYMDPSGEPVAEVGMRKLRKSPPLFGVMRAGERAHFPELREPTVALLRALNWRGMANVEYKLDPRDGRYRLMEVNGRCFLMMGLASRLGVNHALLSWQEKGLKQRNLAASLNDWNGVWIHLLADVYYGLFCQGIEKLGFDSYLLSYRRPKTFAVWSARDPAPFAMQWAKTARRALELAVSTQDRRKLSLKLLSAEKIARTKQTVGHVLVSFLKAFRERCDPAAEHFHIGPTTQDILDTGLTLMIKESHELVLRSALKLADILCEREYRHRDTLVMGRTHQQHAVPTPLASSCQSGPAKWPITSSGPYPRRIAGGTAICPAS